MIEITSKKHIQDVYGKQLSNRIKHMWDRDILCRYIDVYHLLGDLSDEELERLAKDVFSDGILHDYSIKESFFKNSWRVEVSKLPGISDTVGKTASEAIADKLGKNIIVYHCKMFSFDGENITEILCEHIAPILHSRALEEYKVYPPNTRTHFSLPKVDSSNELLVKKIRLNMSKKRFEMLAGERKLSLTYNEFSTIKRNFKLDAFIAERRSASLDTRITDVELELLSHFWNQSNKHILFNSQITYNEEGENHAINSLFKTFICGASDQLKKPYVVSAFDENSGIIKFNHQFDVAIHIGAYGTHFSPYSCALSGILQVQRGVLGTGLGANPIAISDILCFCNQDINRSEIPNDLLHPAEIYENVIGGVEHGCNKMGIPIVNGSIKFSDEYLFRPLIYCGALGIIPSMIKGVKTSENVVMDGHLAVLVGGCVSKDGNRIIQSDPSTTQSTVRLDNPLAQKKMLDFLLEARNGLLYSAISGNSFLSSSICELAKLSGGCEIYLDKCPLNQSGLKPWEILVSGSDERMVIALPSENLVDLIKLAKTHNVEITVVGKFTDSGRFHVTYADQTVAFLDIELLYEGLKQRKLKATWKKPLYLEPSLHDFNLEDTFLRLLSSPNITSKEKVVRRFDHEAKGISVIKPIMAGPADAAVIRPYYSSREGLVFSHGLSPSNLLDCYAMTTLAFDEAIRNAISAGARFGYLSCAYNLSWPDVQKFGKIPEQKLGNLVRAAIALYDCSTTYNVPIVTGEECLGPDTTSLDRKYTSLPTILVTAIGKIDDIRTAMSSEFKTPGDFIYMLGTTSCEFGGSELYHLFKDVGNRPPKVNLEENAQLYKAFSSAIEDGLVSSAHDVSQGGLAIAFAECAVGFMVGADLDIHPLSSDTSKDHVLLFSESPGRFLVSVKPENVSKFEYSLRGTECKRVGRVRGDKRFIIKRGDKLLINKSIEAISETYHKGV